MYLTPHTHRLIDLALDEDLACGDVTSEAIFTEGDFHYASLVAKLDFVLSGRSVFNAVMQRVNSDIDMTWDNLDGDLIHAGTTFCHIYGSVRDILKAERTALNFLQRMSGIATETRSYVSLLRESQAILVDTRKTLPGWRSLDKYAVSCGGGRNHRHNLGAGIMIKDNHIAAAGSITEAITRVRARAPHTLRIEVEVSNLDELREALGAGADIIMLDNMSTEMCATAVKLTRPLTGDRPVILEVSGNVTLSRLPELAATGIDIISTGAITHSAPAADISLKIMPSYS